MNYEILVKAITPKHPWTFNFEDIFDEDEEFIKKQLAKQSNPSVYLTKQVLEYMRDNWEVEDIIHILEDYVEFVPMDSPVIVDMPERFY